MIELRHLRTLTALRDGGTLVSAAERLHLTQSALSHQLAELEGRLGCTLFIRKSKPPRFTSTGHRLLQLADELLPMVRSAERDIARLVGGQAGRLFISIECHSCFQWLIPALDRYRNEWPEVELDLSSAFNFAPLPALARGDLDLVITSDPVSLGGIAYEPLFRFEAMVALAPDHRLRDRPFIVPDDLAEETLITYPVDRNRLDIFTRFLDPADVEPRELRTAELTPMLMQLVATGRGVASLPNWALTEYLERNYVIVKPLGKEGQWSTLYAAVREDQLDAAYVEEFLRTATETSFATLSGIRNVTRK